MTDDELRAMLDAATPDWCVYSEPDVNLPPSLFAGKIGAFGFGPIEPLQGHDLNLAAAAPDLAAEVLRLRAALRFYASESLWDHDGGPDSLTPMERDGGQRALAALKGGA